MHSRGQKFTLLILLTRPFTAPDCPGSSSLLPTSVRCPNSLCPSSMESASQLPTPYTPSFSYIQPLLPSGLFSWVLLTKQIKLTHLRVIRKEREGAGRGRRQRKQWWHGSSHSLETLVCLILNSHKHMVLSPSLCGLVTALFLVPISQT